MKLRNLMAGALSLLFTAGMAHAVPNDYIHPGLPLTTTDLNRIKANLTVDPWKTAYASMQTDSHAQLTYVERGPTVDVGSSSSYSIWKDDMSAVHMLALMWWFTGNTAYADKAVAIIDSWATTETTFSGDDLACGDIIHYAVAGPDILRAYSGWTSTINTDVKNYFSNVLWRHAQLPSGLASANQGADELMTAFGVSMFCDDDSKFALALQAYRFDPCGGLLDSISNGELGDDMRDQGHAWGEMYHLLWEAKSAYNEGIDLFGEKNNRLLAVSEFYCQYNLGLNPAFIPFGTCYGFGWLNGGSPTMTASMEAADIVNEAYVIRKGLSAPYTTQWIAAKNAAASNGIADTRYTFIYSNNGGSQPSAPPAAIQDILLAPPSATSLTDIDLGTTGVAGSSSYSNGTWTVTGGGSGLSGGHANCHFAYVPTTGNCIMVAKLTSQTTSGTYSDAGILLRDSLSSNNANCAAELAQPVSTGSGQFQFFEGFSSGSSWNQNHGAVNGIQTPQWFKVVRDGTLVSCFHSPDGINWTPNGEIHITSNSMYIGLFVSSQNTTGTSTATFTNVAIDSAAGSIGSGLYTVTNRNSGLNLDVVANSGSNGGRIDQWSANGKFNQLWYLTVLGGGKYRVIGLASEKALDVTANSNADGANMEIWTPNNTTNQQYTLIDTDSGYDEMEAVNSGKAVEVSGSSTSNGANVDQSTYTGASSQQWQFVSP